MARSARRSVAVDVVVVVVVVVVGVVVVVVFRLIWALGTPRDPYGPNPTQKTRETVGPEVRRSGPEIRGGYVLSLIHI